MKDLGHRKIIETYYLDINNLAELLAKLVNSYRLLIGGAAELNTIALARKNEIKDALDRADALGDVIDDVIEILDTVSDNYIDYCLLKSAAIKAKVQTQYIETEIDAELKLKED